MPKKLVQIKCKDDDISYQIKGKPFDVLELLLQATVTLFDKVIFDEETTVFTDKGKFKVIDLYLESLREELEQNAVFSKGE